MEQLIQQLIDEFVPKWIRTSPVENVNTTDAMGSIIGSCSAITDIMVTIFYAKQGIQGKHRFLIASTKYEMLLEEIPITQNSTVILRFRLQFKDTTPCKYSQQ
ncbi:hypothetical protein DICVIV_09101 [Dictyocaulus viviparus]|uniref:Uncharacterized protein n=1 Tax=Dictyocaulus viviparus TaxID=29172 RepID=A0A0D8XR67_DICVI|nr:hypothetical protein DICVIV_09101 [Dictyocaulus viviparus]